MCGIGFVWLQTVVAYVVITHPADAALWRAKGGNIRHDALRCTDYGQFDGVGTQGKEKKKHSNK